MKVAVEKSSSLRGISQCWRGVVQQQVELGGPERARGTPHRVGIGGSGAVPGLRGAWRGVGAAPLCSPPSQSSCFRPGDGYGIRPLIFCCAAVWPPAAPAHPRGCAPALLQNSRSPTAAPGPWLVPWPGPGWSALAERGWGCRPSRRPRACPAAGLSPVVPHPAGAAVPGGGGAGAGPRGAILRAVPAPARRHGGALRATGRLRAGLGPGLRGGFAAALLPYHPARESRERGAGAGTLLPGPDAWAPSAPAREPQGLPDAPLGAVPPAWPCGHPARPLRSQPRAFRR